MATFQQLLEELRVIKTQIPSQYDAHNYPNHDVPVELVSAHHKVYDAILHLAKYIEDEKTEQYAIELLKTNQSGDISSALKAGRVRAKKEVYDA